MSWKFTAGMLLLAPGMAFPLLTNVPADPYRTHPAGIVGRLGPVGVRFSGSAGLVGGHTHVSGKKWWDVWWEGSSREGLRREIARRRQAVAQASTGFKVWIGILVLVFVGWIAMMMVDPAQRNATHVLSGIGVICLLVGLDWWNPAHWRFLNMTFGQIREHIQMGDGPPPRAEWQRALAWLGIGLSVLAQWRSCSGV